MFDVEAAIAVGIEDAGALDMGGDVIAIQGEVGLQPGNAGNSLVVVVGGALARARSVRDLALPDTAINNAGGATLAAPVGIAAVEAVLEFRQGGGVAGIAAPVERPLVTKDRHAQMLMTRHVRL